MRATLRHFRPGGLILITCLVLHAGKGDKASTGTEVGTEPAKAGPASNTRAIHYQLPKNYFEFNFKLKTTTKKQGAYCDVARYFFEVPSKFDCDHPGPRFEIGLADGIGVSELAQPDPGAAFDLTVKSGVFTESNLTLGFGDANILTGAQSTITDHKVDFFVSILKTVAGAATNVIPLLLKSAPPPPLVSVERKEKAPTPEEQVRKKKEIEEKIAHCRSQLDEEQRLLLDRLGPVHKMFACSLDGELQAAYLAIPDSYKAYADAYERDQHHYDAHFANALALFIEYAALTTDEAGFLHPSQMPGNSDAFAAILKARDDRKKAIRQQFFGSQEDTTDDVPPITWTFGDPGKEVELFSFDSAKEGGFCFRSALEERWVARPIGVDTCDAASSTLVGIYAILRRVGPPPGPSDTTASGDQAGVAYRIPGRATLRVFARKVDGTEYDYFYTDFDIAQYGRVKFLPARFGSSSSYNVALDPKTGALKNLTIGAKPLLSGDSGKQIDDAAGSLLGVADAVFAAKKKPSALDAAQSDEQLKLTQLKIQMIETCKSDPSQSFCATLLK